MIEALRVKTRVSNAAARFAAEMTPGHLEQLLQELADFMPDTFPGHAGDIEACLDELTVVIDLASELHGDELLEALSSRWQSYRTQLVKVRAQQTEQLELPTRTPVAR
jgi:hypothetical protein